MKFIQSMFYWCIAVVVMVRLLFKKDVDKEKPKKKLQAEPVGDKNDEHIR